MPSSPRHRRAIVAAFTFLFAWPVYAPLSAQTPAPPAAPASAAAAVPIRDTTQAGALRVFIDCRAVGCDLDFFQTELRWATVVRDRMVSDVVLLVTTLPTGAGGQQYTIAAIGQEGFKGRADTATLVTDPNDVNDVVRRQLTRAFGLLLAPYAIRTPLASHLTLRYDAPTSAPPTAVAMHDPWNFWVYRLSANGFGNGEQRQSSTDAWFNISANRVTADLKINLDVNLGYSKSRYELSDGDVFTNLQRNYGANALVAKSVGGHLTVGAVASNEYSDFYNYRLNLRLTPAVEWNLFDYSEATRRQLTAYYRVGAAIMRYQEPTINNRTSESRPFQEMAVAWSAQQPWGSVNMSVYGSQYLHALQANRYGVQGFVNLRIAKGLALNFGGNYSRVNDQLYLRRGTLSDDQVIARQRAMASNYQYFVNAGVSYTFGSIFNAVVNPRFGRASGGGGNRMVFSF